MYKNVNFHVKHYIYETLIKYRNVYYFLKMLKIAPSITRTRTIDHQTLIMHSTDSTKSLL